MCGLAGLQSQVNVQGLRNVIDAVKANPSVKKLVYTSSFFALGYTDGHIGDEDQVIFQSLTKLHHYQQELLTMLNQFLSLFIGCHELRCRVGPREFLCQSHKLGPVNRCTVVLHH